MMHFAQLQPNYKWNSKAKKTIEAWDYTNHGKKHFLTLFRLRLRRSLGQKEVSLFIIANFLHDLLNVLIQLIHQFFVLFGDFVGDSKLIFHSLQWVLGHVAKGLDGGLSPFVQSSIGISFQVNYLQSERKHSAAFQSSLLPVPVFCYSSLEHHYCGV